MENCIIPIKQYFEELEKGQVAEHEVKLIVVGNGRLGKTSLLKRWLDNSFNEREISTHGITIRVKDFPGIAAKNNFKSLRLNIWDFGGQDIYHSTHRYFMQTDALFLLAWDAKTENEESQEETLKNGKKIVYKNYSKKYWLSYIKTLSNGSPVIIVQTKRDKFPCEEPFFTFEEKREFNIKAIIAVESEIETKSEDDDNGFLHMETLIKQNISLKTKENKALTPSSWYKIKQKIWNILDDNKDKKLKDKTRQLSLGSFITLCEEHNLDEIGTKVLLEYFHNSGLFYYKEGLFGNKIVLDQQWAIDAIYRIFNRKDFFVDNHQNGRFTGNDLSIIWSKPDKANNVYSTDDQELFVSFMLQCEICFEKTDKRNTPFVERIFIAPQLLPTNKTETILFKYFLSQDLVYYKYKHQFLHAAIMQRFIVRCGNFADEADMWQQGILFKRDGELALIEAFPETNEILIRIKKNESKVLLDKVRNGITEITDVKSNTEEFISFNGLEYVSVEKLIRLPFENKLIETENKKYVTASEYFPYLSLNQPEFNSGSEYKEIKNKAIALKDNLKLEQETNYNIMETKKINIFFSYSHKDEILKEELDKALSALKHGDKIKTWNDRELKGGDVWDEVIKEQLEKADLILLLISADFMASKYIWEVEITKAIERHNNKQAKVIPIFLRDCDYQDMPFAKLQGYPKDAKPVNSFKDRDKAFTQIAKGIRSVVETFLFKLNIN